MQVNPHPVALLRFVRGMSQQDLATSAGVSRKSVSRIENGAIPRLNTARSVASVFGVDVTTIFPKEPQHD